MANVYTWTVTAMNCYPQKDDNTNVVFTVHWTCAGTDGTYSNSVYNTCNIPLAQGTFTPYADLTQEQVLGWCWANDVNKDATEEAVGTQLANLANPPVVTQSLPWTV
tara:strand:+ start:1678 stop:1998 length:321 start_codon:yes stop_codon:yes gene_type:complete